MDIGNNIKKYRKKMGITQQKLAEMSNMSRNALINYENNKREIGIKTLNNIANALNVSIETLLDLEYEDISQDCSVLVKKEDGRIINDLEEYIGNQYLITNIMDLYETIGSFEDINLSKDDEFMYSNIIELFETSMNYVSYMYDRYAKDIEEGRKINERELSAHKELHNITIHNVTQMLRKIRNKYN